MVTHRSSPSVDRSRIVSAESSSSAVTASANLTPCLVKFARAFAGSHSDSTFYYMHKCTQKSGELAVMAPACSDNLYPRGRSRDLGRGAAYLRETSMSTLFVE